MDMLSDYSIQELTGKYNDPAIIIGGDFNGRKGQRNQIDETLLKETNLCGKRQSRDTKINQQGETILNLLESNGLLTVNCKRTI